jgi:hypothetical protein
VVLVGANEVNGEQPSGLRLGDDDGDHTSVRRRDDVGVHQRQCDGLVRVATLVVALEVRREARGNEGLQAKGRQDHFRPCGQNRVRAEMGRMQSLP